MRYPVKLEPAPEGGFVASFRDIPEALTQGESIEDALAMAEDALVTAMEFYFEDKRPVPAASKLQKGEYAVDLPASVAAKVLLLNEMLGQNVSASELARRLGTRPQDVNRLTDLAHTTKIDTIAQALKALGKRLEVSIA